MPSKWNFRWLLLYFLVGDFNTLHVTAVWPTSISSELQLLGIFYNKSNISEPVSRALHSCAMFKAAILLSQQYNITIGGQFIDWRVIESQDDVLNAFSSTCLQISTSNIVGIVGPSFSRDAHVIAPFAAKLDIPVISHAATDPELSNRKTYPTFYRTIPSDNTAALVMVKLFIKFNWTSCIVIYQNDAYGSGGAKAISEIFDKNNLTIIEMIMFDTATRTIRGRLKSLLTSSSIRIIILWADLTYTSLILQHALDSDVLGPQFTWILSSPVPLKIFNQTSYPKLVGMLTVESVAGNVINAPINTTLLNAAYQIWQKYEPETFPESDNVADYALFAFDATWSLIQSLQQLCSKNTNQSSSCISFANTSSCFYRQFLNSSSLLHIINTNSFLGISGPVEFSVNVTDRIKGTYYIVRNVQSLSDHLKYVPVLVWSDSDEWKPYVPRNTIIWSGKSLTPPTGYATIEGVTLRVAVIEAVPFTMTRKITDKYGRITQKTVGYIPDLIEELRKKMGFIANIIPLPSTQTYTGLIDAVENNVYDMVVGDVSIIAARRERVAFSSPIYDSSLRIITRDTSTTRIDLFALLELLSIIVWTIISSLVLWSVSLHFLNERQENNALESIPTVKYDPVFPPLVITPTKSQIRMSIRYFNQMMMGYGGNFHITTVVPPFTIGILIGSLVFTAVYQVNLTPNLMISKSNSIISGIDDIKNGKISSERIGIIINSSIEDYYLREISDGDRNFHPLISKEDMYDKLLNNTIDASILGSGVLEYMTNDVYCNLTLVGESFARNGFGIVFQKNWLYEQDFDVSILSLRESGLFDNLKNKWFKSNNCSHSSDTRTGLTRKSRAPLFSMIGIFSISLSLLFYIWLKRRQKRDSLSILSQQNVPSVSHSTETPINNSIVELLPIPIISRTWFQNSDQKQNIAILCFNVDLPDTNLFSSYDIKLFNNPFEFIATTLSIEDKTVYLITSTNKAHSVIPIIHRHYCIEKIYLYRSMNTESSTTWSSLSEKISDCYSDSKEICNQLINDIRTMAERTLGWNRSFDLFTTLHTQQLDNQHSVFKVSTQNPRNEIIVIFHCDNRKFFAANQTSVPLYQFADVDECVELINRENESEIFLIISGNIIPTAIQLILNLRQIHAVYLFRSCEFKYAIAIDERKLSGLFDSVEDLSKQLFNDILFYRQQHVHTSRIDIFSMIEQEPKRKLINQLSDKQIDFLSYSLFIDILPQIPSLNILPEEFEEISEQIYPGKGKEVADYINQLNEDSDITKFNQDPKFSQIVLGLHKLNKLNDLFVLQKPLQYIQDKVSKSTGRPKSLTVYFAKIISDKDLKMIQDGKDKFIRIGIFILATKSLLKARTIARKTADNGLTSVLFQIEVVEDIHLLEIDSNRVIFRLGAVFRLESINPAPDGVWYVKLKSTVWEYQLIREQIKSDTEIPLSWLTYGNYLHLLKQSELADSYFEYLLKKLPAEHIYRVSIYNNMALRYTMENEKDGKTKAKPIYDNALKCADSGKSDLPITEYESEPCIVIQRPSETFRQTNFDRSTVLGSMGDSFYDQEDYPAALEFYRQALASSTDSRYRTYYQQMIETTTTSIHKT